MPKLKLNLKHFFYSIPIEDIARLAVAMLLLRCSAMGLDLYEYQNMLKPLQMTQNVQTFNPLNPTDRFSRLILFCIYPIDRFSGLGEKSFNLM